MVLVQYRDHYDMKDKLFHSLPVLKSENKLLLTPTLEIVSEMQKYPPFMEKCGVTALKNFQKVFSTSQAIWK